MAAMVIWERDNGSGKKKSAAFIFLGHIPGSISCEASHNFFPEMMLLLQN